MTSFYCVICRNSTQCFRCEIKELKQQILDLKSKIIKYESDCSEQLALHYYNKVEIRKTFSEKQMKFVFDYENKLSNAYFITITFDPNKFGVKELTDMRKDYILHQLTKLYQKEMYSDCYGCFEHHKNGIIHSHLIMITAFPKEVRAYLKSKFTDNVHNKVVIQLDKAKYPQAAEYIEKESVHYYKIKENKEKLTSTTKTREREERNARGMSSSQEDPQTHPAEGSKPHISDLDYGI